MVKLQNVILSLDTLLSLKRCVNVTNMEKEKQMDHRPAPFAQCGIECIFEEDITLTIPGISVESLMIIVSHLSQVYAPTDLAVKPIVKGAHPQALPEEDDVTTIISHAVVGCVGMLMGVLMGKFMV